MNDELIRRPPITACTRESNQDILKRESGDYTTDNMFISFFYSLLRDYIHPGDFQKALENTLVNADEHKLTNGWLAKYAEHVYRQLKEENKTIIKRKLNGDENERHI